VPAWATRQEIARHVLGDETRTDDFSFVSAEELVGRKREDRAIRFHKPATLPAALLAEMRATFEEQLARDVEWTVDQLLRSSASGAGLAERVMRWGDFAGWTDAAAVSYFERYLSALEARKIRTAKKLWAFGWRTYDEFERNGLEELLSVTEGSYHEIVKKTITLRSTRDVGYEVSDRPAGRLFLQPGSVVGRWFSSNDRASAQLMAIDVLAYSSTRREAEVRTRNASWTGNKVVLPAPGGWVGAILAH
jgi:hypothetical protein